MSSVPGSSSVSHKEIEFGNFSEKELSDIATEASNIDLTKIVERTAPNEVTSDIELHSFGSQRELDSLLIRCGVTYLKMFITSHRRVCKLFYRISVAEFTLIWMDMLIFAGGLFINIYLWKGVEPDVVEYNQKLFNGTASFFEDDQPLPVTLFRVIFLFLVVFIMIFVIVQLMGSLLDSTRREQLRADLNLMHHKWNDDDEYAAHVDSCCSVMCWLGCRIFGRKCCPRELRIGNLGLQFIKQRVATLQEKIYPERTGFKKWKELHHQLSPHLNLPDTKRGTFMFGVNKTKNVFMNLVILSDNLVLSAMAIVQFSGYFQSSLLISDIFCQLINSWKVHSSYVRDDFQAYVTLNTAKKLLKECQALSQLETYWITKSTHGDNEARILEAHLSEPNFVKLIQLIVVKNEFKRKKKETIECSI